MKYFFSTIITLFFITPIIAQTNFAGEYKINTTGDIKDISNGVILTLNCNNIFIQKDSISTGYGKWYIKNYNELTLQFDSIAENGRMDIVKSKLQYLINDERIYSRTVTKKEYKEEKKQVENYYHLPYNESFLVYKEKALKVYFLKMIVYTCN